MNQSIFKIFNSIVNRIPVLILAFINIVFYMSCNDEKLMRLTIQQESVPPIQFSVQKNRMISLNVNYCTQPSKKRSFKTKFLVIFDRSGSNQDCPREICGSFIPGTDPDNSRRYDGMLNYLETLTPEQKQTSSFGLIDFNDPNDCRYYCIPFPQMDRGQVLHQKTFLPPNEFIDLLKNEKNPNNRSSNLIQDLGGTNYQTTLDLVLSVLTHDINVNTSATDQYAYVIIFVSDGAPTIANSSNAPYLYRQSWQRDLKSRVSALTSLNSYENVLGISLNTVYYSSPGVPPNSGLCDPRMNPNCVPCIAGDPSCTPQDLLAKMAHDGGGNFLDYTLGGNIDFTRISLPSIYTSYNLVEFYVNNKNVEWKGPALASVPDKATSDSSSDEKFLKCSSLIDSDFDGVDDCLELKLNTPPNIPNGKIENLVPYKYSVIKEIDQPIRQCYTIKVENITVLSSGDRIEFLALEQANLFESSFVLRKAEKSIIGEILNFNPEDFK